MTAPVFIDRVMETSLTSGTGPYALLGAVPGYQSFSAVGDGSECYYAATDAPNNGGTSWEVGLGTYSASAKTLARTQILASSNNGNAVVWQPRPKFVWLDLPAALVGGVIGSVTEVSVQTANGFAGLVANPFTTPTITLETTVDGFLYGDGTAVAAATASQLLALLTTMVAALPTSLPGTAGQLWNNGGVISVS